MYPPFTSLILFSWFTNHQYKKKQKLGILIVYSILIFLAIIDIQVKGWKITPDIGAHLENQSEESNNTLSNHPIFQPKRFKRR